MRLSRAIVTFALVAALPGAAGCIENMEDLKLALGAVEEPPAPVYAPPIAKAHANATTALTGVPIRFFSDGTKDPQGLPLSYLWDFGDERGHTGPVAMHLFSKPGEYLVRLTVRNSEGLADDDTVPIRILAGDMPPTAAIRVVDATGAGAERALAGQALGFDALASDPEGRPLRHEWDFGDGATSHDARATHAFEKPGVYDVRLRVEDAAGQTATATARVRIGAAWTTAGSFEPAGADTATLRFPLAPGASALALTLTFPASAGLHDATFRLLDASGAAVATATGETAPGTQGDALRTLALDAATLSRAAPGEWSVEIVKKRGLSFDWTLDVRQTV